MKIQFLALIIFGFLLPFSPAIAGEAIGVIVTVEEEVLLTPANSGKDSAPIPAQVGQAVHMHDILETGEDARALVLFIDETELTLGENAELAVDEYVFSPDTPALNKARYNVLRGAFLYASGLITKQDRPDVAINTTYGTIGIRGTKVWGGMLNDRDYSIFLLDGEVTYQTKRGRVKLMPGEGTSAYSERAIPTRAKVWGQPKIDAATATIALRNTDAVNARITEFKKNHNALRKKHQEKLDKHKEENNEENKQQQEQRLNKKTESGTRYVPASRQQKESKATESAPVETGKAPDEMPAPPAMPVEEVKETELAPSTPAKTQNKTEKTDDTEHTAEKSELPITKPTPSATPVEEPNPPKVPAIPREGNEAPAFEEWEQKHLELDKPRAPSAL